MTGAIINHLWQSTLFAVAAGLLTLAFRKNRAQVRYWLWFSTSVKFLVPFALLVGLGGLMQRPAPTAVSPAPVLTTTIVQIAQPFAAPVRVAVPARETTDWMPFIIGFVWACGFLAIALLRLRQWLRMKAILRASRRVKLPIPLPAFAAPGALEPGVVGFLRPTVLLPEGMLERLTPAQLDAVLAHELCHARRRDNLTAAIHMIAEAVFWFHPLVWWIGARLVDERECACDETVLSLGSEPRDYAEGILKICKLYVEPPLTCVSGITGSDLKQRIHTILTGHAAHKLSFAKSIVLAAAGIAAVALPVTVGVMQAPLLRAQSNA